jgi:CRISPR-associated protein Cmr3
MFEYLVCIRPLGLLYGSAGRFLSPENLVGRSGVSFPPSAATLSGLFAAQIGKDGMKALLPKAGEADPFCLAGPFWAMSDSPEDFFVPTPFNRKVKFDPVTGPGGWRRGAVKQRLGWRSDPADPEGVGAWERVDAGPSVPGKFAKGSWLNIRDWDDPREVYDDPWAFLPHLHPRLQSEQRRVDTESERGSLFLENAVQLHPDVCLVYLASHAVPVDWYRFGGEGHLVEVESVPLGEVNRDLLRRPVGQEFALITPALWGSNRLSQRFPQTVSGPVPEWQAAALLTERPTPMRYRLGDHEEQRRGQPKLLSRGRSAVPAGTVYRLREGIDRPWWDWDEGWFPREGPSLKRWGLGLALPV